MTVNLKKTALNTLIAGAFATTMGLAASDANAADTETEKCYGVVKAGKNDCGNAAGTHSCAGQAATDAEGGEWISLPKGICEKLAHGSLVPVEDHADEAHEEEHADDEAHDDDHADEEAHDDEHHEEEHH